VTVEAELSRWCNHGKVTGMRHGMYAVWILAGTPAAQLGCLHQPTGVVSLLTRGWVAGMCQTHPQRSSNPPPPHPHDGGDDDGQHHHGDGLHDL
jgi:hypothetical protein